MGPNTTELVNAHAVVSPLSELVERRRATYEAAIALATSRDQITGLDAAVIDNPMLRGHLAEVLGGLSDIDPGQLTSVESAVTEAGRWHLAHIPVRVASSPSAIGSLTAALRRVGSELQHNGARGLGGLLIDEQSPEFTDAANTLRSGVDLAFSIAPDLVVDLMPHVVLIAMLHRDDAGRLGSASAREYPGLVVLPAPLTALEAAEALIHEGAHQKFFDLAIVGSIFAEHYHLSPTFTPPWATPGTAPWPFEQTVAAFHAYCSLSAFWARAHDDGVNDVHSFSLLPLAARRANILGTWIVDRSEFLGKDGCEFLARLIGANVRRHDFAHVDPNVVLARAKAATEPFVVRQCGRWRLVVRWTKPAEITWLRAPAPTMAYSLPN